MRGGGWGDGRLMQRVSARTGWRQWVLEQPSVGGQLFGCALGGEEGGDGRSLQKRHRSSTNSWHSFSRQVSFVCVLADSPPNNRQR